MDAQTLDQEFEKLQSEFQDVAKAVQALATKMQDAQKAGDANAGEWLDDLEAIAKEVDDEQAQAKVMLLALHNFITDQAQPSRPTAAADEDQPELFAPGQDPFTHSEPQPDQGQQRPHGLLGGLFGGMGGGYMGGGFGQAMEMGMGMQLGADLINNIFR
jgi:hypothetical protein